MVFGHHNMQLLQLLNIHLGKYLILYFLIISLFFFSFCSDNLIDQKIAWRSFEALELLGNLTGIEGLIGRTMCSPDEISSPNSLTKSCGIDGENNWHSSSTYPSWVWKGDTSSDTITGHYFAYGIILDLVANSNEDVSRVINTIDRLTNYIVKNNYYYIDITGEPTKWGRWNPIDLNENSKYYSERGINSLEILSYLALAYSVTGNELYSNEYFRLGYENFYLRNILNFKIDNPYEDNHSDNELG